MGEKGALDLIIVMQFAIATLLPVAAAAVLAALEKRTRLGELGYWKRQVLYGIIFGAIAVFGTEFGINVNGATMNVRDAAPLAAGLYFGGPAGIIAGVIGGVERWLAVYWAAGMFTRVACSVATIAIGIYAALLRRYLFDNQRAHWPIAFAIGVVAEVFHLLLVFLTNIDDSLHAFQVVQACTGPMVTCNALSVALTGVVVALVSGQKLRLERKSLENISQKVQAGMLIVVLVGFIATTGFIFILQQGLSTNQAQNTLSQALQDVEDDIEDASNENLLGLARRAAQSIPSTSDANPETISELVKTLDLAEIDVVDENGIIVASSNEAFIGYDMASGEQSAAFLVLLPGGSATSLAQQYMPMSWDESVWQKYAGVTIKDGFLQVAYDAERFAHDLKDQVGDAVANRHIEQQGFIVVLSESGDPIATHSDVVIRRDDVSKLIESSDRVAEGALFDISLNDTDYLAMYRNSEGLNAYALLPTAEVVTSRDLSVLVTSFMEVLVFAALFAAIFLIIKRVVVRSIWQVNGRLGQITKGDLGVEVDVRNSAEFASLSDDINETVSALRKAIADEAKRIERDLKTAKAIQESALPNTFPPFPDIKAFDIYASMTTAREVGGDFYDFFMVNNHTLGFLIADVSGKGIPAALFMMTAKAELSNYIKSGMRLSEAVQCANKSLCQGNDAGMFVTVWAATLDYDTGELTYVNAGHNYPLLRHDGTWTWIREKCGLCLGVFDTAEYTHETIALVPGDELLLYTDGVTEALNVDGTLLGESRLEEFLAVYADASPHVLIDTLNAGIRRWAKGAVQSDDITILCLEYGVPPEISKAVTVPATNEGLSELEQYMHFELAKVNCPHKTQNQIDLTIEELFVNVCEHGYSGLDEPGKVKLAFVYDHDERGVTVSLIDWGVPFDPTRSDIPMPDLMNNDLSGMGIAIAVSQADNISYVRDGNCNVTVFRKAW